MVDLAVFLLLGLMFIGGAVALQVRRQNLMSRQFEDLELRPNCLLTRYPIAFVSGQKSLFKLFSYWNQIPRFLREHGYDVVVLEPAIGHKTEKPTEWSSAVLTLLDRFPEKIHIVADSSRHDGLEFLAQAKNEKIASLTVIRNVARRERKQRSFRPATASELRPLAQAIEVFSVEPCPMSEKAGRWTDRTALVLLKFHNMFALKGHSEVDAVELAEVKQGRSWNLESRFLDLAVSLAERDARPCGG
jgi:hypothetical protein